MVEDALPAGWREVDDTDQDAGRYNPQPISRFEHTETGLGVRLTPTDPNAGTGSGGGAEGEGEYRVTVGEDGSGDPSDMRGLTNASGHADALGVAREFMDAYTERCVDGEEDLDSVLAEYGDRE